MNRAEKIEMAAKVYIEAMELRCGIGKGDMYVALREALKPEIAWDNVQMGDVVNHKKIGKGMYIAPHADDAYIQVLHKGCPRNWPKCSCTFEPQRYTKLIKHPWPEDGKQPDWVKSHRLILVSKYNAINGEATLNRAEVVNWDVRRDWFVVIAGVR